MAHQFKEASFGVYEVLESFEDRDGEEIFLCHDSEGTFELAASSVRKHKTIDRETYIELTKEARLQAINANYTSWEEDLQRQTKDTLDDAVFYLGNHVNKSCTAMSAEEVKIVLSLSNQIGDEEFDKTFQELLESHSASVAFVQTFNKLAESRDIPPTQFIESTPEAFLNHCLVTNDQALIRNATDCIRNENELTFPDQSPKVYWLTSKKQIKTGTTNELLSEFRSVYPELIDHLDRDINRSTSLGRNYAQAVCEAVHWTSVEYGDNRAHYEAFSDPEKLLNHCKTCAQKLVDQAEALVDQQRPARSPRKGQLL